VSAFRAIKSNEGRAPVPFDPVSIGAMRAAIDPEERAKEKEEGKPTYEVFFPGPMYFHCLLNRSLVEGFRGSQGAKDMPVEYSAYKFNRPLITNCGEWNNRLCVMDRRSFLYFKQWLTFMKFVDRGRRLVFVPVFEQAAILDPFLLDGPSKEIKAESATVFCPMCKDWRLKPKLAEGVKKEESPEKIELEFVEPLPESLKELERLASELSI